MTVNERKQIIEILEAKLIGENDNLYKANMQFGGMSESDLNSEYYQSGRKCKDILKGNIEAVDAVKKLIAFANKDL